LCGFLALFLVAVCIYAGLYKRKARKVNIRELFDAVAISLEDVRYDPLRRVVVSSNKPNKGLCFMEAQNGHADGGIGEEGGLNGRTV